MIDRRSFLVASAAALAAPAVPAAAPWPPDFLWHRGLSAAEVHALLKAALGAESLGVAYLAHAFGYSFSAVIEGRLYHGFLGDDGGLRLAQLPA